jgi:hypothetical protein
MTPKEKVDNYLHLKERPDKSVSKLTCKLAVDIALQEQAKHYSKELIDLAWDKDKEKEKALQKQAKEIFNELNNNYEYCHTRDLGSFTEETRYIIWRNTINEIKNKWVKE